MYERKEPSYIISWSKSCTAVFKISKISIDPSPRNGISAETSKTLLILRFLATGAEETNESDFGETGFFTTSSCKLEISAKGLRPFFPLTYIKIDWQSPSVISIIIGDNKIRNENIFRMVILEVMTIGSKDRPRIQNITQYTFIKRKVHNRILLQK